MHSSHENGSVARVTVDGGSEWSFKTNGLEGLAWLESQKGNPG